MTSLFPDPAPQVKGAPVTTYGEVTGAVMLTRNYNPVVMTWAAGFAILKGISEQAGTDTDNKKIGIDQEEESMPKGEALLGIRPLLCYVV